MITNVFGLPVMYEDWNHQNALPVYMTGSYDFSAASIGDRRCIVLTPEEELGTLPALKKHIEIIQKIDALPVVFKLETVSDFRRKSLIENNIPFITDKQVYLPFIGAILTDIKITKKPVEKFTYSAQLLLLYYLYGKNSRLYISDAGKVLPFTAMTMSRAAKQLEDSGLFRSGKDGVKKYLEPKYSRSELFKKAKPYLSSPIRKAGYINKDQVTEDMVFSGETALSEKTMLNPGRITTYVVYEKNFDRTMLTDELIDPDQQARLELWAYNPKLFSKDKNADDLSVVLSFLDTTDERIEEALAELEERRLQD